MNALSYVIRNQYLLNENILQSLGEQWRDRGKLWLLQLFWNFFIYVIWKLFYFLFF